MVKAIEAEHFDQLPGGVFNKGFVRAYAKHLGLNDEEAVTEYLAVLREAQIGAQTAEWQPGMGPETRAGIEREAARPNSPTLGRKSVEFETKSRIPEAARQVEQRPERAESLAGKHQASSFRATLTASDGRAGGVPWKIPVIVLAILVAVGMFWGRHSRNTRAGQTTALNENTAQTARADAHAPPTPSITKGGSIAGGAPASLLARTSATPCTLAHLLR